MAESASIWLHIAAVVLYGAALAASLPGIRRRRWGTAGLVAALVGLAVQIAFMVVRGFAENHFPVTGLFESLHFLAFWAAALAVYFRLRYDARAWFPAAMGLVLASLAGASFGPRALVPLTPALDTPLFFIHVATSFAAYGLFGAAAILGAYRLAGSDATFPPGRRMLDESLYLGYILFTWTMLAGSLWAYLAWGSYWTWNTKGLWSYLLWFYYSGVIHVRNRAGWQGWPLNLLALAGFLLVLFTFLGLGILLKSNHPLL
jgi:ABC-type transport system involved in cytochrome c biogenesis permease subunit